MVDWSYYDRFDGVNERFLPSYGEGENQATQVATAVNKLIYKWYNDGDVYDNRAYLTGWCNDLSSYANWLAANTDCGELLNTITDCICEDDYEELLKMLADNLLNEEVLEAYEQKPKVGSVYECDGPVEFVEPDDDDEW